MSAPAPTSPPSNTTAPTPSTTTSPPSTPAPTTPAVPSAPPPASPPPPTTPSAQPPASTSPPSPPSSSPPPPASTSPPSPPSTSPPSSSPSPPPPSSTTSSPPSSTTPSPPSSTTPSPPSSTTPSPPTTKSSPPPPTSTTTATPSGASAGSSGISTGVVVGIAIGGVAILLIASLFFICCNKRKRRRRDDEAAYYVPPPPGPKDGSYGGRQQYWQQNAPPPPDRVVAAMQTPTPPPPVASRPSPSSEQISMPPPPPPPPFMSSSGGSGSIYSGSENPYAPPSPGIALGFSKSTFSYDELARATDGFSNANLLGQGGFGYVHKGVLPNGKEVAVKQLKAGSGQGEREFQAEVEIISRVHHKHLVSLVGYCITGSHRLLVYEFVPNNTLEFHLHGKGRPTMDWPARLKIALGSAKGLAYLHEDCHPKIIHRDIKASNILLDFKFEAKVADFGLAKMSSDVNTHISTRVMGTFGYLAPEYASSGKLTDKSDVFSFGVMLLELITGRRPVDSTQSYMEDSLVDWARPLLTRALEDGNFDTLIDQKLQNNYDQNEMARMVACAAACVRHSARRRPRTSQVVRALEGDVSLSDLNEGIRPGNSRVYGSYGSSDYDTSQYNEDMKKFRKMALGSQEYGASSEYSGPTSEYGLNPSGSSSEGQNTREMEMGKMKKTSKGFSGSS